MKTAEPRADDPRLGPRGLFHGFGRTLRWLALIAIPLEGVSFLLLISTPIDVPAPPPTNPLLAAVVIAGVILHIPIFLALAALDGLNGPTWLGWWPLIVLDYLDIVALLCGLVLCWKGLKRLLATLRRRVSRSTS